MSRVQDYTYRMTYNVDPPVFLKLGMTCDPQSVQLVCLQTHGLYHLASVVRHEQGYIEQDRVRELPHHRYGLVECDIRHGETIVHAVFLILLRLLGIHLKNGAPLDRQDLHSPVSDDGRQRRVGCLFAQNLS